MEFRKDTSNEKYMLGSGKEMDAEKILHLFIYNYMKKRGLHEAAKTLFVEAKIEMSRLDYDDSFLKDWWDVFWPQFYSRMTKQPGGNLQSSAQPSIKETIKMLTSLKSPQVGISQKPPTGGPLTSFEISQQRDGKRPMYTDTTSILGHSGATSRGTGPLGFPFINLLPTEITPVPHPCNSGHMQMPVAIQPPPLVVGAPWSVQLEPNYLAGEDSAYPPVALHAGEDSWKNQVSLTGARVRAPDGPDPDSFLTRVPATFLEFMQQEAEAFKCHSNTPPDKF